MNNENTARDGHLVDRSRTEHRLRWVFGAMLLFRLLFPFFNSPLTHIWSDPARHWANGERFLNPDVLGATDPYLYQLWIYLIRTLSHDSPPTVLLACGILCAAMPYGWYRALKELIPRKQALIGGIAMGLVPSFLGIYAYFMNETLLLTLSGFCFWLTFRAWRKRTLGAWTLACAVWTCAIYTRAIAVPAAGLSLFVIWVASTRRLERAVIGIALVSALAVPAGLHVYQRLGFFAPLGNTHLSEIYAAGGHKNIDLDFGPAGRWGFGTPSFYNPTFYPFSGWTTDRDGTVSVKIDLSHGSADWISERERVRRESPMSYWQFHKENLYYLLFAQSWPDNDPNTLSGLLSVWTRWLWPGVMAYVAWGVFRRRFRGISWLLPVCSLSVLAFLALQSSAIIEGRYVKPVHPILLAAAIVLYLA